MKPVLFRSTALGLLCLAPALAAAQEPPSLDPIVVTASRQPEPQSQALGDVSGGPRDRNFGFLVRPEAERVYGDQKLLRRVLKAELAKAVCAD